MDKRIMTQFVNLQISSLCEQNFAILLFLTLATFAKRISRESVDLNISIASYQKPRVAVLTTISFRHYVVAPAFEFAWKETEKMYPHMEFKRMDFTVSSENCDHFVAQIADEMGKFWDTPDDEEYIPYWLLLTSACTPGIIEQAAFAREWNSLMVSSAGSGNVLGNKQLYPTLIRFSPGITRDYAMCLKRLLEYYSWHHLTMFCDSADIADTGREDYTAQACSEFQVAMQGLSMIHGYHMNDFLTNLTDSISRAEALKNARRFSVIILIVARMDKIRNTMLTAWELDMINENFVYISYSPYPEDHAVRGQWGWQRNDSYDQTARQAYRSLLFVSLTRLNEIPHLHALFDYVEQQASKKYNKTGVMGIQQHQWLAITSFLVATAAVQMMNETIALGWNFSDGVGMYQRMINREFPGFDNHSFYINSNGDKSSAYAVWGFANHTDEMVEILRYSSYRDNLSSVPGNRWIWEDSIPDSRPLCEFAATGRDCHESDETLSLRISLGVLIPSVAILASLVTGYVRYKHVQSSRAQLWIIPPVLMVYPPRKRTLPLQPTAKPGFPKKRSSVHSAYSLMQNSEILNQNRARYREIPVWIKRYKSVSGPYLKLGKAEYQRLYTRIHMLHQNIAQFYGIVFHPIHLEIVTELAVKGSVDDVFGSEAYSAQTELKYSFINDLVSGLSFIHASALGVHGKLKATNCVIDKFLTLKLTDFGTEMITRNISRETVTLEYAPEYEWSQLYLAPEILLRDNKSSISKSAEVYSFGILLHQILHECLPFGLDSSNQRRTREEMDSAVVYVILEKVKANQEPPFRPNIPPDTYNRNLSLLMASCWNNEPEKRPTMHKISKVIATIPGLDKQMSYTEAIVNRLQSFADELVMEVHLRTKDYKQEKKHADDLLHQIIPKIIAEKLQRGEEVPPEMFDEVTICFTSVANFAHIVSTNQPLEVGRFLNTVFQLLDSIIQTLNVYKVETISDSYMVASGLPERNEHQHSAEIARMALRMLEQCVEICLRNHLGSLLLKVGMHSGTCAAAVIGTKMPRYCLFGDTVNTASRMVSFGEGAKIHVSADAFTHLNTHHPHDFAFEERGVIEIKGKGDMHTYWLAGQNRSEYR